MTRNVRYALLAFVLLLVLAASPNSTWANATQAQSSRQTTASTQIMTLSKIYIPGAAFGYQPTVNFESDRWGLTVASSITAQYAGFVITQPVDWIQTTPFTVTLYFAMPLVTMDSVVNWRLTPGGAKVNLPENLAQSGWDALISGASEDGIPLTVHDAGGHFDLMKSQSWTTKWSDMYHTWYFGSGVNTANDFISNPIWQFSFTRGTSVGNGETYPGDIIIVGAEITYWATPRLYFRDYMPIQLKN